MVFVIKKDIENGIKNDYVMERYVEILTKMRVITLLTCIFVITAIVAHLTCFVVYLGIGLHLLSNSQDVDIINRTEFLQSQFFETELTVTGVDVLSVSQIKQTSVKPYRRLWSIKNILLKRLKQQHQPEVEKPHEHFKHQQRPTSKSIHSMGRPAMLPSWDHRLRLETTVTTTIHGLEPAETIRTCHHELTSQIYECTQNFLHILSSRKSARLDVKSTRELCR